MFSGEDSSGDPFNSRNQFAAWALSQTACSSSKDNVDWAALAQQWIQMKESCSISTYGIDNSSIPAAPPPPQISSREYEEQGEAPMEVVKEDEPFGQGQNSTDMVSYSNPTEWQSTWFQNQAQFCPSWNTWSANSNNMPLQMPQQQIQIPSTPSINILKDNSHVAEGLKSTENLPSNDMPMDAAKRKTLPAWIREGLEKMEKEKLKQLEKNRAIGEQEFKEQSSEKDIVEKRSLLFQNNSDKSEDEEELGNRYDKGDVIDSPNVTTEEPIVEKSKEERIEELMLVVRKSLTELLLEVTNEEILTIAQEAFRKNKAKASSVQVFRKSALTSITSKLGLGAYEDSGSENSDDESNKSEQEADESYDSEEELKESIRARHDAFKLIAQKIEASCMTGEEKEYRRNMENSEPKKSGTNNGGGGSNNNYDNDSGETHPEKKMNINGKRIKERTSRFSSIKDSKYKSFYPTTTGSTGSAAASASTSSMATSSHNSEYDKRKGNHIAKQNSQSTDSSSSSSSSSNSDSFDSDTSHSKHRKSKSSRNKSDKSKIRDRRRERSRARDRDRNRDRARDRSRDRDRDSDRSRHRDRDARKDRERTREKDLERHRERDQEKNKNGDRTSREKSKDHDSEKIRDRHRERSKERERTRERGRDHDRDREKEKDRLAKKSRSNRKQGRDSDSDEYSSRRSRHHTTSSHLKGDRSRSNSRSRSRSRSY